MRQSIILGIVMLLTACQPKNKQFMITPSTIQNTITAIATIYPDADTCLVARGVQQVAA